MSFCVLTTVLTVVLVSCQACPASGSPIPGVVRASSRPAELLSGRDFLAVFTDKQGARAEPTDKADDMDQSAEPSSMIGEITKVGLRRRNYQNRVIDNSYVIKSTERRPSVDLDDPVFGSRQSPKYKTRYSYLSQNTRLPAIDKGRNDINGDRTFSHRNISASHLQSEVSVKNKPLYGSDFRNYFIDGFEKFSDKSAEVSTSPKETATQSIIALGESRSYSSSTNVQNSLSKDLEDNSLSLNPSEGPSAGANLIKTSSTTATPDEVSSTVVDSLTTIVHSTGENGGVESFSWTTGTRWAPQSEDAEKIISVKVSSSVGTSAKIPGFFSSSKINSELSTTTEVSQELTTTESLTLLTEEQPRVTAVQRSQLSVEEAAPDTFNPQISPVSYQTSVSSATSGSRVQFYSDPPSYHRRPNSNPVQISEISESATQVNPKPEELKLPEPEVVKSDPEQYKHETRVERVSYHQEVVSSAHQGDVDFGKKLKEERQTDVPYLGKAEAAAPKSIDDQRSYQFTNIHDQSFHHVQVTHHSPEGKAPENVKNAAKDGRFLNSQGYATAEKVYGVPEENYEVDEAVSVMTNGRAHGIQGQLTTEATAGKKDSNKFGYVVEGRNFRKYRVEERTSDGFIVGEYGVVRHDDGSLRGVRYTADSTINPRVIYDALVKFLSL